MRRSLFAAFRSADGRSLARALALLVLVSVVISGTATGYATAAGSDRHCTTNPDGTLPSGHDGLSCCPGMVGGTPAAPPPSQTLDDFQPTYVEVSFVPHADPWVPPLHFTPSDQPRGPPAQA